MKHILSLVFCLALISCNMGRHYAHMRLGHAETRAVAVEPQIGPLIEKCTPILSIDTLYASCTKPEAAISVAQLKHKYFAGTPITGSSDVYALPVEPYQPRSLGLTPALVTTKGHTTQYYIFLVLFLCMLVALVVLTLLLLTAIPAGGWGFLSYLLPWLACLGLTILFAVLTFVVIKT